MHDLIKTQKYDVYISSLILLLRNILYEYDWDGPNSKYRDTEYQYHLYYVRELIQEIIDHLDVFYNMQQAICSILCIYYVSILYSHFVL